MVTRQNMINASDRLSTNVHMRAEDSNPLSMRRANRVRSAKSLLVYQEREPNETTSDALLRNNMGSVTGVTKTYNGQVSQIDLRDTYAFSVSKSMNTVNLKLSGSTGNLNLALYNSAGQLVGYSSNSGSNESIAKAGLAAGTYYAKVSKVDGVATTNNYSLAVSGRESLRQVKVTITNLNDTDGDLDADYTFAGQTLVRPADFDGKIKVGANEKYFQGPSDQDSINPYWQVSSTFAASENGIPISISAYERDTASKETVDLHPSLSIDGGLTLKYDVSSRRVYDSYGIYKDATQPITLSGSGNNHDAQITFKVEETIF